jgi:hypothetical protein
VNISTKSAAIGEWQRDRGTTRLASSGDRRGKNPAASALRAIGPQSGDLTMDFTSNNELKSAERGEAPMVGTRTLSEIEARINIIQDNIRQLIEQAAAASGLNLKPWFQIGSLNKRKNWSD